jgi:copper(I)-binding protein
MRRAAAGLAVMCLFAVTGAHIGIAAARQKDPSISGAWVKLPATGATTTEAYVTVENPTMYAFYVVSAASSAAGSVELRQAGKETALTSALVDAYGSLEMGAKSVHLVLRDLKKPLAEGDTVTLTVTTEAGVALSAEAKVRKE